jgi:hypothetical protein
VSAIEAVAEAIREAYLNDIKVGAVYEPLARAAVAAIAAQGDITDEQIMDAVPVYTTDAQYLVAVRALLARQSAVHATREAEREAKWVKWAEDHKNDGMGELLAAEMKHDRLIESQQRWIEDCRRERTAREAAEARVAELEAATPMYDPRYLFAEQQRRERAEAEVTALRATVERVTALCDESERRDDNAVGLLSTFKVRAALSDPKGEGA